MSNEKPAPKSRPIDPLELAKVVPPAAPAPVADGGPAPTVESHAAIPAQELPPAPEPVPAGPPLPRYRVLEDRVVSLGGAMTTVRKGKVVSDETRPGLIAVLEGHKVPMERVS